MTKKSISKFLTQLGAVILFTAPAWAEPPASVVRSGSVRTLADAYASALKTSERITISEAAIREAEAVYRQTLGSALPEFSYRRDMTRQDRSGSTRERMFRLSKSDLSGYRELAEIRSDSAAVARSKYEHLRAEQLLLADVAGAFYGLLQSRENTVATKRLVELGRDRLSELQKRVRVGRTREADAISQELQITTLLAQLEETERLAAARADLLAFLAGAPLGEIVSGPAIRPRVLDALDSYLARVVSRPDVRAVEKGIESAKADVDAAKADQLPQVDATANMYTDRPKAKGQDDWDVSLTVDIPLFDWGERAGAVDEAKATLVQEEQEHSAARRSAELDIRNAYRDYASALKQMELRQKSVDLARREYEHQARDDRQGLVTSLEVIESLNRLNAAELALAGARLTERLAAINLEIAAGASPGEILK